LLQNIIPIIRIATVLGPGSLLVQFRNHLRKRHFVRLTDADVDQLDAGIGGACGALGAFDLLKFIDGGGFSVLTTADALGKQVLNVRFCHDLIERNRPATPIFEREVNGNKRLAQAGGFPPWSQTTPSIGTNHGQFISKYKEVIDFFRLPPESDTKNHRYLFKTGSQTAN
jgi:hypothetical protein